jgi:carbamoyltransferase
VTGGVFLNVKVNSLLADLTPGKFCAMPLAGDQGAGLGVYRRYLGDLKWPDHLFWGIRDAMTSTVGGIINQGTIELVKDEIIDKGMVNLVRGSVEFGPRALCHTSTLALPNKNNVEEINQMNGRDTIMPMALVCTERQARDLFEDVGKVHKSLEYMIVTRRFKKSRHIGLDGGALWYPRTDEYTCRPQTTKDPLMMELLEELGPLINTSFNVHGVPIVFTQAQIEASHIYENQRSQITTILMED